MVYLHLQLVLVALISLATARDRWVWSGQRSGRHLVRVFNPFFPPPFLRPALLPPLGSEEASLRQTRKPKVVEVPDAAEEVISVPSRPTARGVTQDTLVVQPLPLDISKLPLETSGSDGFQEVFAPHPAAALRSSEHHLALTLPGEDHLTTFQQDTATPSLQTKTGHVEALVATPDISQLPLQSPSFSSLFETSSFSDAGPAAPGDETPSPSRDAVVFPVKILEEGAAQRWWWRGGFHPCMTGQAGTGYQLHLSPTPVNPSRPNPPHHHHLPTTATGQSSHTTPPNTFTFQDNGDNHAAFTNAAKTSLNNTVVSGVAAVGAPSAMQVRGGSDCSSRREGRGRKGRRWRERNELWPRSRGSLPALDCH